LEAGKPVSRHGGFGESVWGVGVGNRSQVAMFLDEDGDVGEGSETMDFDLRTEKLQ
jgi:hypothetical protein